MMASLPPCANQGPTGKRRKIGALILCVITLVTLSTVHGQEKGMLGTIVLPKPRTESHFSVERALLERRSVREFSKAPLSLEEVSQLLWAAQGVTHIEGMRTAPSAGALYPLELYLVASNVAGLEPAVYHYSATAHTLRLTAIGDRRPELARVALGQLFVEESAAVLVFSAIERKTTRKYGHRGIRYIHIEVGHSAQNVFLQAQALGVNAAVVGAFDDERMVEILNLPQDVHVVYLMPLGKP
jgi:SagB-type dehydrogenase family enzyme